MKDLLTTKELAAAIGASESSLRRWTNSGAIATSRTVGGHRRITMADAIRFIRETKATVVRPDILGMEGSTSPAIGASDDAIYNALLEGNAEFVKAQILGLYLGGASLAEIFDGPLRQSMHRVGELWQHSKRGIVVEHRANDICLQAISQLRELLPVPATDAPVAIGGAPQGDRYLLPSLMVATALADSGYQAINLGPETPVKLLGAEAAERDASLVWLSVSVVENKATLQRDVEELAEMLHKRQTPLVLGGRLAAEITLKKLSNVHLLASVAELVAFTRGAHALKARTHPAASAGKLAMRSPKSVRKPPAA